MADLISRAAAIEYLITNMNWHDENGYEVDDADDKRAIITDLVNGIPAADAEHVVHGQWDTNDVVKILASGKCLDGFIQCTICGIVCPTEYQEWNYCPNCGAKMDG